MPEVSSGLIGDFPYSIWEHDTMRHLCGYLGLPPSHCWYGLHYDDIDANVHGGLTYAKDYQNKFPNKEYLDHQIWWVGFDCSHVGDWTKFDDKYPNVLIPKVHKWTRDEVFNELVQLADQAYAAQEVVLK